MDEGIWPSYPNLSDKPFSRKLGTYMLDASLGLLARSEVAGAFPYARGVHNADCSRIYCHDRVMLV